MTRFPRVKSGLVTNDQLIAEVREALGDVQVDERDLQLVNALVISIFTRWMKLPDGDTPAGFKRIYDENKQRAVGAIIAIIEVTRDLGDCKPNDVLDALNAELQ